MAIRTLSVRGHPSRCRPARRWNTVVRAAPGLRQRLARRPRNASVRGGQALVARW